MDKSEKTQVQYVQNYCFCPVNMQICDVLVADAVVVPKFLSTVLEWTDVFENAKDSVTGSCRSQYHLREKNHKLSIQHGARS